MFVGGGEILNRPFDIHIYLYEYCVYYAYIFISGGFVNITQF